jgi:Uma2 family endonuclease
MSLTVAHEILDAIDHLPNSATLVVPQVKWEEYERLLEDLGERSHLRVTYDCGRLEIMSPSREHEMIVCLVEDLVLLYCQTFQLALEKFGHTTWRDAGMKKGIEADACYSIRGSQRAAGKRSLDLPPDIAVEIDITSESLKKFPLYAALSVPEVWWCDGRTFRFYELTGAAYVETERSRFLPTLTGSMLTEAIEIMKTEDQTAARESFLRRIQSLRKKS